MSARRPRRAPTTAEQILGEHDGSLLDVVDNVLNKGVVLNGDLTIALAHVDLIYARLSLLLCAADRVMGPDDANALVDRRREARLTRTRPTAARR